MGEIWPANSLARAAHALPFDYASCKTAVTLQQKIDGYLSRNNTTGLLLVQGNRILSENYQYDRNGEHRFTSFSMAKTVIAMLIGVAVEEGLIKSIDDLAQTYATDLVGTEYGTTPIQNLLTMSSGVAPPPITHSCLMN